MMPSKVAVAAVGLCAFILFPKFSQGLDARERAAQTDFGEGQAQAQPRPEILILGTFHMANPGHDVHNMEADDVLSAARQQEMAELIEVLRRFRPTKIAVEAHVGSRPIAVRGAEQLWETKFGRTWSRSSRSA